MNPWSIFALISICILFLGYQSGVVFLAIAAFLFATWIFSRQRSGRVAQLHKGILYLAIIPFSFWWFLSPSIEGQISPWLFFIPAWFCLFLALMQWRSLGRGGELVFVRFNALAAFLFSIRNPDRYSVVIAVLFIAVFLWHIRPRLSLAKWLISLTSVILISFLTLFISTTVKANQTQKRSGNWGEDYYLSRHIMGFDPVASLGSFEKNYDSKYDDQIVLRLWTSTPPIYFKAVAYERFFQGLWKVSNHYDVFYPERYEVDYALFELESKTENPVEKVWVQSALNTFHYLFAPSNATGVSVKAADSVYYYRGGVWHSPGIERSDWYYFKNSVSLDTAFTSSFLSIEKRDLALVRKASLEMGLDTLLSVSEKVKRIRSYIATHFRYSLYLPIKKKNNALQVFWDTKSGYCEYYATLATLLLRDQKIPARYVVGFAFPEFAENGKYSFFRRRHSHAWVEYFDSSWKITDPTPIVAQSDEIEGYWTRLQEKIKAQTAYVMHVIKEGAWRQKLDTWQVITEKWLTSFEFYLVIALLFGVFFFIKRRKRRLYSYHFDTREMEWRSTLKKALGILEKMGYRIGEGETIGNFIIRVETLNKDRNAKVFEKQIIILKKYQKERWRPLSID